MSNDTKNLALYCDFENIALGVRDANYARFEINEVLERLLVKGNIVVKKAYCDWERYKGFKADMHEASFELIEIPQRMGAVRKNAADIKMAVDAIEREGLALADLDADARRKLREQLPPAAFVHNPIDVLGDAQPDRSSRALRKAQTSS